MPAWPGWSGGYCWQADDGIIADRRDAFQRDVASALDGPFDGMDHPRWAAHSSVAINEGEPP